MELNSYRGALTSVQLFERILEERKQFLFAQLRLISSRPEVLAALKTQNQEDLKQKAIPAFLKLKQEFQITHLYFINPQKSVILRAHRPKQFGDQIARGTLLQAEQRGVEFAGAEIGRFGQFTLRALKPIELDGKLIGYIELGQELGVLLELLSKNMDLDIDLLLDKKHFSLKSQLKMSQDLRDIRWHTLQQEYIAFSSDLQVAKRELPRLDSNKSLFSLLINPSARLSAAVPMKNYAGVKVGRLVFSEGSEGRENQLRYYLLEQTIFVISTFAVLWFFGGRINRSEKRLQVQEQELRDKNVVLSNTVFEVKEAQAKAEAISADYQVIMANLPDVFFRADMTGKILMVTPACEEAVGYRAEELVGRNLLDLHATGEQRAKAIAAIKGFQGGKFNLEVVLLHKSGAHVWISSNVIVRTDENGVAVGFEGIARNVTEAKEFQSKLQDAKYKAEAASQAKSTFLTMMSHELRTPMNGVLGMAQLLGKTELDAEQADCCAIILESGNKMVGLLSDILDLSKVEAGKQSLAYEPFSAQGVIRSIVGLFSGSAASKGIELKVFFDPSIKIKLIGDVEKLNRILTNLVGNSIKFTEAGEISISLSLVDEEADQQTLRFEVSDTGIGVEADKQQQIFEPFRQADERTTRNFGGTGLGLAIVKQLVELQGGTISLRSHAGQGSTFLFELVFGIAPEPVRKVILNRLPKDLEYPTNLNCLLVEDDELNQHLTVRLLSRLNVGAEIARDGAEAVKQISEKHFDLILLDLLMPKIDGYDVARIIRTDHKSLNRDTPIIVVTAAHGGDSKDRCLALGVNAFCAKPLEFASFEKVLLPFIAPEETPSPASL